MLPRQMVGASGVGRRGNAGVMAGSLEAAQLVPRYVDVSESSATSPLAIVGRHRE